MMLRKASGYLRERACALSLAGCVCLALTGCAAPARIEMMRADTGAALDTVASNPAMKGTVGVKEVTGGKETNPMWVSNISSGDFERALEDSLRNASLLAPNRQNSKYILIAHLRNLDQPMMGFNMTVTATVQYTLVDRASGKTVYEQTIATPYTATVGQAFAGTERLRLANEGAAKANIGAVIDQLARFSPAGITLKTP